MSVRSYYAHHGSQPEGKSAQIESLFARCEGAYSDSTLRGYAADLRSFQAWCRSHGREWLPADPATIADFVDAEAHALTIATLKRRLSAIKFAHRYSDLADPTLTSSVQLAIRRASRRKQRRPVQAKGLTSEVLHQILKGLPTTTLAGLRDAALICVGYDTLCRSCELAAMTIANLRMSEGGDWSVLITRSKGDQAGDGRIAWLSPKTVERLKLWLEASGVAEGPLFRALHLRRVSEVPLNTSSIRRLVKRAAPNAQVEDRDGGGLSGHSMRVGAAQDMLVTGFDALAIMQAGGWKSTAVLLRYVENASTQALHQRRWTALELVRAENRTSGLDGLTGDGSICSASS